MCRKLQVQINLVLEKKKKRCIVMMLMLNVDVKCVGSLKV